MKYKNRIRLITTQKGYRVILGLLRYYEDEGLVKAVINNGTCKIFKDIAYFNWTNLPDGLYKLVNSAITLLISKGITYRLCIIDKNRTKTSCHTEHKDEYKKIPDISVISKFNENKINQDLYNYSKNCRKERRLEDF